MSGIMLKKENDRTILYLSGYLDTDFFYNDFMDAIFDYQFTDNSRLMRLAPVLSFENVTGVDSNLLPCLTAVGVIMKNYYNKPCQLRFDYGIKGIPLLQFLSTTKFLDLVKYKLKIYDYDEENVGGFSLLGKSYNPNYTIEYFSHIEDFYGKSVQKQNEIKYQLQDDLIFYDVPRIFGDVLKKVLDADTQEYDWCVRCVAEIIANAELYSLSDSFASVQAKKNIVRISLCDVGIGFTRSLRLKRIPINNEDEIGVLIHRYDNGKNGINRKTIEDLNCFLIALKEAEESALYRDSNNLYRLIEIVTSINGIIKIHFNRTQVSFDNNLYNVYKNCTHERFLEILLNNFNNNPSYLHVYKATINGVHIEIEIEFEDSKGDKYDR